jgi:sulfite reductase (NADPH) flavoprotein alpha-component
MPYATPQSSLPIAALDSSLGDAGTLPFEAPVLANAALTDPASGEKRHVELDLRGSGLTYEPGDALSIAPRNDPVVVERLLACLKISEATPIHLDGRQVPLGAALTTRFEIAVASPRFLKHWATLSDSPDLRALIAPENTEGRRRYLRDNHIGDIVRSHPVSGLAADALLPGLRPLQPRLFSIASSASVDPDLAAIASATLTYPLHGELRRGVVSGYQIPHARPGSTLRVSIEADTGFRLAADDAPIIMVGAGTGVAPFRAFVAERRARRARGRSWLFFGQRTSRADFIYRAEWQQALEDGYLADLDLAFSRDLSSKIYVQHRLLQHGRAVYAWLQDGASLYVCGDAARMAPAVHAALIEIVSTHGNMGRDGALDYIRRLARAHRYCRSIY